MAAQITGDFDIVAEFSIPGVNRILAAMHSSGRFPHAISAKVDDNPPPGLKGHLPTMVAAVNEYGEPIANQEQIGNPNPSAGAAENDLIHSILGNIVNVNFANSILPPIVPSHLQGHVQIQLFPPTVTISDPAGTKFTISLEMLSRYFPDPHTAAIAQFLRGTLQITAPLNEVVTQACDMVDININAGQVIINYTPSNQALSPADIAAIDLAVRNALRTSFLPSNNPLPSNIQFAQFKLLPASPGAVALLVNLTAAAGGSGSAWPGNPGSMNSMFVSDNDQFALAVGRNFILSSMQSVIDNISSQFPQDTPAITSPWNSHAKYRLDLTGLSFDLRDNNSIVLIISVHAEQITHRDWAPSWINITAELPFNLIADGPTADLNPLNNISITSLDSSSELFDWLSGLFTGYLITAIRNARDQSLANSGADDQVRQLLNVNSNLGGFLNSLLTPPSSTPLFKPPLLNLAYTNVQITSSGIVLHGTIAVADQRLPVGGRNVLIAGTWPAPDVEFEQIPSNPGIVYSPMTQGPDYTAFKSWIPGGTITQYEWSTEGPSQPFRIEQDKFVLLSSPQEVAAAVVSGASAPSLNLPPFNPLCLTIRGTRLSSFGPVVAEPVSGSVCAYNLVSVISGGLKATGAAAGARPTIALAQPGPSGQLEVTGHFGAQADTVGRGTPNVVVHFATPTTAPHLEALARVVNSRKNKRAATVFLAVAHVGLLPKLKYIPGVIFAEEHDHAWANVFGVKSTDHALTLIVNPEGKVLWHHTGDVSESALATALEKHLVSCGMGWAGLVRSNLRIGQPAPNFLFPCALGRDLTLRKLIGRNAALVFWRSTSPLSVDAVRELQHAGGKPSSAPLVVLAINDGEDPKVAQEFANSNKLTATIVPDPNREISSAYGVQVWPTVVSVGTSGLVTAIQFGRHTMTVAGQPTSQAATGGRQAGT
ncbi:MAG TPA: TlpA disulfide reductase family protein [Terriglobales bacterium]|nr:TlpA disulfide reductase family protein [Terriglobales bacterium]